MIDILNNWYAKQNNQKKDVGLSLLFLWVYSAELCHLQNNYYNKISVSLTNDLTLKIVIN